MRRRLAVIAALCLLVRSAGAVDVPIHTEPAIGLSTTGGFQWDSIGTPQVVTVSNAGPVTVPFTAGISGPNAADFTITEDTCQGSLASASTCQISIVFQGGAAGATAETAALNLEASGGQVVYSIPLSAAGLTVTLAPSSVTIHSPQAAGVMLSRATATWSDGRTFSGSFSITADLDGLCRMSGVDVVLNRTVSDSPTEGGTFTCTVTATP